MGTCFTTIPLTGGLPDRRSKFPANALSRTKNAQQSPSEPQALPTNKQCDATPEKIGRTLIELKFTHNSFEQPVIVAPIDDIAQTSTPAIVDIANAQPTCQDFADNITLIKKRLRPSETPLL
jgi:hypothetical protein